jgi:hypothetical protein
MRLLLELIIAGSVILSLLFYLVYKFIDHKSQSHSQSKISSLLPKENLFKKRYTSIFQKSYVVAFRIPFLSSYIKKIRLRLEATNTYDEYSIRKETMKITLITLGVSFLVLIAASMVYFNVVFLFLVFLAVLFINGILIDTFVHRMEDRLLKQLKEFLGDVRHFYQQSKMVDEAVYQASLLAKFEAKLQADHIYEILTSTNPTGQLRQYESVAPNRFLKAIASIAVLVQEKGDIKKEDGSVFLNGLSGLTQEINFEILRRDKLSYVLKGLSVVAVLPVFFTFPLRSWAITYFPSMTSFYDSRLGVISQILLYLIIFVSYSLIRKMREINETKYSFKKKNKSWLERIYRIKPVQFLIDRITPSYYQKQYFKMTILIQKANSPLKIEWLYLQRTLVGIGCFLIVLSFFLFSHYSAADKAINSVESTRMLGKLTENEKEQSLEVSKFDRSAINHFKEVKSYSNESVAQYLSQKLNADKNSKEVIVATSRITQKLQMIENAYLKWWEFLIVIAMSIFSYHFPVVLLKFQAFLRTKDMEDEVNQFYTIINVISEFGSVSVENVLEWMERFSVIFKEPLNTCLLNYDSGAEKALYDLKEEVTFVPFGRIVDRLHLATTRITIKEAFDDIDLEKQFYIEQRNRQNEKVINEKAWWGQLLGLAPVYCLMFLYLVIPMIYISVTQTADLMNQFN